MRRTFIRVTMCAIFSFSGLATASAENQCGLMCDVQWNSRVTDQEVLAEARRIENLEGQTAEGYTALGYTAGWGRFHALRVLIARGANIYHVDLEGNTPYHYSLITGMQNEAFRLILAGVDPYQPDASGVEPIAHAERVARENRDSRLFEFLSQSQFVVNEEGTTFDMRPDITLSFAPRFRWDRQDPEFLEVLASRGNANAALYLAYIYRNGGLGRINRSAAEFYAKMAIELGHPHSLAYEIAGIIADEVASEKDAVQRQLNEDLRLSIVDSDFYGRSFDRIRSVNSSGRVVDRARDPAHRTLAFQYFYCEDLVAEELIEHAHRAISMYSEYYDGKTPNRNECLVVRSSGASTRSSFPSYVTIMFLSEEDVALGRSRDNCFVQRGTSKAFQCDSLSVTPYTRGTPVRGASQRLLATESHKGSVPRLEIEVRRDPPELVSICVDLELNFLSFKTIGEFMISGSYTRGAGACSGF